MNSSTNVFTRYVAMLMLGAAVLVGGFALVTVRAHAQDGSIAPVLSNIASSTTDTAATITWSSDQPGTTQVLYGLTSTYNASSSLQTATTTSHTSFLGGLTPNTLYHFEVVTGNASGTMATSSDMTFTTASSTPVVASTTPVISGISATPTDTGVTIIWNTDINANSQVLFGTTTSYGSMTTLNPAKSTSHSVTLTGLTPSTLYHFQVWSTSDLASSSADMTFTTAVSSSTGTSTDTTGLQAQIDALKARVSVLEAQVAALLGGGGTGTTTPPTTSSGTLDQNNITVNRGGALNFGGRGFPHEENITITLNGSQVGMAHADGGGNFSTGSLSAPTIPGTYTYVFTGSMGGVTSATITVL